ncbi:rRNA maturation RNase YbeY [candidate division WWE3 bacterium RBG_19FT_COMBO_53_11]|uniref:rRNA maturation RNase YbeY n=1 Tax=candidate division WWE3 bacterium RBG_19FT_COMBO_53_11 TaxID=1802613 RepID=A0A1F4UIC3_UNCKA|nr:MAG: rRNA maturation RNase YbeY [candidate division WWE3 bacterium RBG_19FT_COMBO_53_11]
MDVLSSLLEVAIPSRTMEVKITVSFISPKKIQKINQEMRGKSYTPAVLSFPYYDRTEDGILLGEILICKPEARKLAKKNGVTLDEQINALIVHGTKHILGVHED